MWSGKIIISFVFLERYETLGTGGVAVCTSYNSPTLVVQNLEARKGLHYQILIFLAFDLNGELSEPGQGFERAQDQFYLFKKDSWFPLVK